MGSLLASSSVSEQSSGTVSSDTISVHTLPQTSSAHSLPDTKSVLRSHHGTISDTIKQVKQRVASRSVQSIKRQFDMCRETCPCSGHGGAVITFTNGEKLNYSCSSVELGAIMYYYDIEDAHFTCYIDEGMREQIDAM